MDKFGKLKLLWENAWRYADNDKQHPASILVYKMNPKKLKARELLEIAKVSKRNGKDNFYYLLFEIICFHFPSSLDFDTLIEINEIDYMPVRKKAQRLLFENYKDKLGHKFLLNKLRGSNTANSIRTQSIELLKEKYRGKTSEETLTEFLNSPYSDVQAYAIEMLLLLLPSKVDYSSKVKYLSMDNEQVRSMAIASIKEHNEKEFSEDYQTLKSLKNSRYMNVEAFVWPYLEEYLELENLTKMVKDEFGIKD